MEQVVLVDHKGRRIGQMEKLEAHQKGVLHSAFSIFILNENREVLLQKRASTKYHSGGLWSNACCSHPRPDENVERAAARRLYEEMGLSCHLDFMFSFNYSAVLENGLIENEYDYVFIGHSNQQPILNPQEAENWKYMAIPEIRLDIKINPESYTVWFKSCFTEFARSSLRFSFEKK